MGPSNKNYCVPRVLYLALLIVSMKVSGKIVLLTLILSVASLLCGHYVKGSPALFEPKYEQSNPEANAELKIGDKKEIHFSQFLDSDNDFVNTPAHNNGESLVFRYSGNHAFRIQKQSLERIPRYLLYCSLKLDFC